MCTQAQDQHALVSVGFYNLENLFDTVNDPKTRDGEFTPEGKNNYTEEVYQDKLNNLSQVISELGMKHTKTGVALLGVSEIENRRVLEDLVAQDALKKRNLQIVHYDSPDRRGVDVGMLYNPRYFELTESESLFLFLEEEGDTIFTRDILHVTGNLLGEEVHVLVNHWPSRRGGEKRSQSKRNAAADICRKVHDDVKAKNPDARIIVMGDLNDDPVSPSVTEHLMAVGKKKALTEDKLFNPFAASFKKGLGTGAWRDAWSLFDQIIVSEPFITDESGWTYRAMEIYHPKYMCNSSGKYKGYPYRTYVGGKYQGGYSDHFPVCIYLSKKVDK